MNPNFVMGTIVIAAAVLAGQTVYAESVAIPAAAGIAIFKFADRVSFNPRNHSKLSLRLKAGDDKVVFEGELRPGRIMPLKVEVRVKVVLEDTTYELFAGDVADGRDGRLA